MSKCFSSCLLRRIRKYHPRFPPYLIFWSTPHLLLHLPDFGVLLSAAKAERQHLLPGSFWLGWEKLENLFPSQSQPRHKMFPDASMFQGLIKNRPSETWRLTLHYWLHCPGSLLPLIGTQLHRKHGAGSTLIHASTASRFRWRQLLTPEPLRSKSYLGQQWHFPFWNSRPNANEIGAH